MNNKQQKMKEMRKKRYIRGIANKFTKENLFVAVESVDDKTEKLVDLGLKSERLRLRHFGSAFCDLEIQKKRDSGKERVATKKKERRWRKREECEVK